MVLGLELGKTVFLSVRHLFHLLVIERMHLSKLWRFPAVNVPNIGRVWNVLFDWPIRSLKSERQERSE